MTGVFHIAIAMKPTEGTFAQNALKHGVAGLNVDGCRIEGGTEHFRSTVRGRRGGMTLSDDREGKSLGMFEPAKCFEPTNSLLGRWPANIILDDSEQVLVAFPMTMSGAMRRRVGAYEGSGVTGMLRGDSGPHNQHGDSGSAARFFKRCGESGMKVE